MERKQRVFDFGMLTRSVLSFSFSSPKKAGEEAVTGRGWKRWIRPRTISTFGFPLKTSNSSFEDEAGRVGDWVEGR
jgi:hypothetical protein